MHRILHVPTVSEEAVDHFASAYTEVTALAKEDPSKSVVDSNTLQFFAIDVYAYDIAAPGVGCTGEPVEEEKKEEASKTTGAATPSATKESPKECHTHSDGVVHCS